MNNYKRLTGRNEQGKATIIFKGRMQDKSNEELYAAIDKIVDQLADFEDKIEDGTMVELPDPFVDTDVNGYNETLYFVYRSRIDIYCPCEDVFTNKEQAEARLKELQEQKK